MGEYIFMIVVPHVRCKKMLDLVPLNHMTEYMHIKVQYINVDITQMRAAMKEAAIYELGTDDDDFCSVIMPGRIQVKT